MKRFIVALLAATAYSQDTETAEEPAGEGEAEEEEEGGSILDGAKDFYHSEGQKVEFTAIEQAAHGGGDYTLTGHYGNFVSIGTRNVYIQMTVGGGDSEPIPDQTTVVSWAEIADPNDETGTNEAFYCSTLYTAGAEQGTEVDVQTFEGTAIDFAVTATGKPSEWYKDSSWDAQKQQFTQWSKMLSNLDQNYKTGADMQTCSAWRKYSTPSNTIAIKTGTPYKVKTGYKMYASGDKSTPWDEGNSNQVLEFTWEGAMAMTAAASVFASTLLF